jgi:hypothetical protein
MKTSVQTLILILTLLPVLPAMADKDICWKIDNVETDAGTLRLRVVHSIANEHFVLNGVHQSVDGMAYALTGGAILTGSGYKATLLETGSDDTMAWSTNWSLDLDPKTLDGTAKAITSVHDEVLDANSTEAGSFDAFLLPCKSKGDDK